MKVLYIGQFSKGTTSRMRATTLRQILEPAIFEIIDTHIPFYKTNKILRSLGFRYKMGPLINNINAFIVDKLGNVNFDLIWIDKGVFINEKTIKALRGLTDRLVHFSPDPAFTFHRSKFFNASIKYYDFLITTKSYELKDYYKFKRKENILYVTQGYDKDVHKKSNDDFNKKSGLLFIGHHEKSREIIIQLLINDGQSVTLAGINWHKFAKKNIKNKNLNYLGNGVYGEDYVKEIQNAKIAWGAISKWIPELHTTRTFEIPACGTALLTERNEELIAFFSDDEVIFYDNESELIDKVNYYMANHEALEVLTNNGHRKVKDDGYSYTSILRNVIKIIFE